MKNEKRFKILTNDMNNNNNSSTKILKNDIVIGSSIELTEDIKKIVSKSCVYILLVRSKYLVSKIIKFDSINNFLTLNFLNKNKLNLKVKLTDIKEIYKIKYFYRKI